MPKTNVTVVASPSGLALPLSVAVEVVTAVAGIVAAAGGGLTAVVKLRIEPWSSPRRWSPSPGVIRGVGRQARQGRGHRQVLAPEPMACAVVVVVPVARFGSVPKTNVTVVGVPSGLTLALSVAVVV